MGSLPKHKAFTVLGLAGMFAAGGIVFGGVSISCGSVKDACADSCPMNVDERLATLEANLMTLQTQVSSIAGGGGADIPAGAVMYFNLTTCPLGWSPLAAAEGRYLVGAKSTGGAIAATVGTALNDQENRAVGQHNHGVTDPGHSHNIQRSANQAANGGAGGIFGLQLNSGTDVSTTQAAGTGLSIQNAGTVAGTNAPYVQYRICQKD
jgi:hypothetical protein